MGNKLPDNAYMKLAEKWLNGTISPEEEAIFSEWYNENQDGVIQIPQAVAGNEKELAESMFKQIERRRRKAVVRPIYQTPLFRIAAAIIVIVMGMVLYNTVNKPSTQSLATINKTNNDLLPGGNKAILKLADGSQILLDSTANGNIASQGNTKVIKLGNGQLAYQAATGREGQMAAAINTLSTPKGGQYQITLVDGTTVWLNSGSSISFPTAFAGNERVVELIGEGYFEVAKDAKKPFKVKVRGTEVAVLGTHFNIMAYNDESSIKTTLLEGAVKVAAGKSSAVLVPGQQSQVSNGNITVAQNADLEETMAWKNGMFVFKELDMESIMRQVARWYDIEVEYRGSVNKHFNGTILRNVEASKVLKMLEITGEVHFQVQGKKVIVSP